MAGKSNKLKIKKLQINFTNRWLYTLIVFFSLVVIGVFVYAATPNPGHSITQIEQPSGCSTNQFLQWTGSSWTCAAVSGEVGIGGSGTANYIPKFTAATTVGNSVIYQTGGKVGIGTTSPAYKLDVAGTGRFTGGLTTTTINTGNGAMEVNSIAAYLGNQNLRTTDSPTFAGATMNGDLAVGGPFVVTSAFTLRGMISSGGNVPLCRAPNRPYILGYCMSLAEYKLNVKDLRLGLDTIMQLTPREFDWTGEGGGHDLGLIAEEVELVNPLLAVYDGDSGELTGVKYRHMVALLIKAIQEQQQEIENLKQEIEALKTI